MTNYFRAVWRALRGLEPEAIGFGQCDGAGQKRQEGRASCIDSERKTGPASVVREEPHFEVQVVPYPEIVKVALTSEERAALQFGVASAEVQRKTRTVLDAAQGEVRWLAHRRREDGMRLTALHEERDFWRNSYYALIADPESAARIFGEGQRVRSKRKLLRARRVGEDGDTSKERSSE